MPPLLEAAGACSRKELLEAPKERLGQFIPESKPQVVTGGLGLARPKTGTPRQAPEEARPDWQCLVLYPGTCGHTPGQAAA